MLTEDGKPDFNCLDALDLPYLQQLVELINGKTIGTPLKPAIVPPKQGDCKLDTMKYLSLKGAMP